jgi:hypothetical protein
MCRFKGLAVRDTVLRGFARKAIEERVQELEDSRDTEDANDLGALGDRHDIFSRLIIANKGLDKQSLADEEVVCGLLHFSRMIAQATNPDW